MNWYYSIDGETQLGPVSEEDLINAIKEKKISESSLVWNEKFDVWKKVEEVSLLKKHFDPKPPPLPKKETLKFKNDSKEILNQQSEISNSNKKNEDRLSRFITCPNCSAGIELNEQERKNRTFVCPKCKVTIDKYESASQKKSSSDSEEKKESNDKNLPTRWLSFYVNGWLPVGIIANLLGFSGNISNEEIIFQIVWILFLALTFFGLKNRKKWGWYLNWLIIFWLPIGGALMFIDHPYFVGYLLGGLAIFTVPNAIYFKKRRILFKI